MSKFLLGAGRHHVDTLCLTYTTISDSQRKVGIEHKPGCSLQAVEAPGAALIR